MGVDVNCALLVTGCWSFADGPLSLVTGCYCHLILDTGYSILDDILTDRKFLIEHRASSIEYHGLTATNCEKTYSQRPETSNREPASCFLLSKMKMVIIVSNNT